MLIDLFIASQRTRTDLLGAFIGEHLNVDFDAAFDIADRLDAWRDFERQQMASLLSGHRGTFFRASMYVRDSISTDAGYAYVLLVFVFRPIPQTRVEFVWWPNHGWRQMDNTVNELVYGPTATHYNAPGGQDG